MKHKYYEKFNEHLYNKTLRNGLQVFLIPKLDYNKTFVAFTTNYGSLDLSFIPYNQTNKVNQPAGIAHFLEHKLFMMPDGSDAFEKLSSLGVNANAFTTFDKTSYFFSGTENINEAIVYLLDFVQTPYFTKKNVKKEQGIILEELLMYYDSPGNRLFFGLLESLYKNHPVKYETIGTEESIKKINTYKLYQAYNTFYHPANMNLIVVGNFNVEEVIKLIENNQAEKGYQPQAKIKKFYPKEPLKIARKYHEEFMSVNTPLVGIGLKLKAKETFLEQIKRSYLIDLLFELYFSRGEKIREDLLQREIINSSFSYVPIIENKITALEISVMTEKVDEFIGEMKKSLINLKRRKVNEEDFNIIKNSYYSSFIKSLNSVEGIASVCVNLIPYGIEPFLIPEIINSLTIDDLKELTNEIKSENITVLKILPKKSNLPDFEKKN